MPAALISFPLAAISSATRLSISAGVSGIGSTASCLSFSCICGVASSFIPAAWNFSTMARGVFAGMKIPYQIVVSESG